MFFSVTTFTANVTGLFRSAILAIIPVLILAIKPINFKKYNVILILFSLIILVYIVSWKFNNQSYANFLFGAYNRNLGILSMIGLFLLTILSAEYFTSKNFNLVNSMYNLLFLMILYAILQYTGLDPITWEPGAGKGSMLGNINFASALFGMLSPIPLVRSISSKGFFRWFHAIIYVFTIYFIVRTGSSQGFIILVAILLFVLVIKRDLILSLSKSWKTTLLILTTTFVLFMSQQIFTKSTYLLNIVERAGQVNERIEHWKFGIRIFLNHPFTGVGIENMARFAGEYRSQEIRSWGKYILPDKSHNVFIDFFATGGIIVGVCWLLFTLITMSAIIKLVIMPRKSGQQDETLILACVWIGYFLQSLISTDSLLLITCGMMAAGTLIGLKLQEDKK